ncbi:uncharacterized protein [Triticum aestivum]|uniref:uncharacterized protein isoform X3 n=1 Tax=Triticum aestivum TaxID=4565 RepID=UPI001D02DCCC|nr:uncharacterized protein LOC123086480 isoform X3 [Triticum aestivum]
MFQHRSRCELEEHPGNDAAAGISERAEFQFVYVPTVIVDLVLRSHTCSEKALPACLRGRLLQDVAWEGQTVGVVAVVDFFKAKIKHLHLVI